jgi:polyisoprenoid-binding protein YceI
MKKWRFAVLVSLLLVPLPANAYEWQLDNAHSAVMFEVKHIYSVTRGQFNDFSGTVFFDPAKPEEARCEFVVKTDSVDTHIGKRDGHLRSGDFFASKKFPDMRFTSTRVSPAGGNTYMLEGQMTVKDVTRDMQLEMTFLGQKENPFKKGQMVAGFETRFTIDRLEFNVGTGKFYEMGVVGKDVDVLVSLEMVRDQ